MHAWVSSSQVQFPSNPLAPAAASAGKVFLIDRPGASQVRGMICWVRKDLISIEVKKHPYCDTRLLTIQLLWCCTNVINLHFATSHAHHSCSQSQASVYSAEPGVTLDDPDATALDVLGGMLSSFGGALFDQVSWFPRLLSPRCDAHPSSEIV